MMIDRRLIDEVPESKKWIKFTVLCNWFGLLGGIINAVVFAVVLQNAFEQNLSGFSTTVYVLILLTVLALRVFVARLGAWSSYHAGKKIKHHLRALMYQKLASMPLSQVNRQSTSSIIQTASEGVEQLEIYFGRYLPQLFYSLLAPLTLFGFLVFISAPTALVLLICVPLIPLSILAVNKIAKRLLYKYWSAYVGLGSRFLDNLHGLITLKVYRDDGYQAEQMNAEAESFRKITMKVLTMQLNSVSLMDLLAYGGAAVGILTALLQYQNGNLGVFGVVVFILLAAEFFIPLRLLGSFFHVAMNGKAASDKIFNLLDTPVDETRSTVFFPSEDAITVQLQQLYFAYSTDKTVINGLNLTFEPKRLTMLVGESGCGKSTLAALLMGFYQARQGQILFNGRDIGQIERNSLYRHVCLVSHYSYIFKGSLRENLLLNDVKINDNEIYQVLEQVNMAEFVRKNGGLEMVLLSRGLNLSGGQIQRLALARALLHKADFYIFDEAAGNIDIESEAIILRLIHSLKNEKTILMISHRLANAAEADRIYVLRAGVVAEQGDHHSLLARNGMYAEMFNRQKQLEQIRMEADDEK